jgi:hypothetical protein
MKKIIIGLIAMIFIGVSCKKEEPYIEPSIEILSLSSDTVNIFDTLRITYKITGIDSYLDIMALIDGYTCEVLSNSGSIIEIIVPYGVRDYGREISLKYQDYISPTFYIDIDITPKVTDFFPKSGSGGDTLRIIGFGFDKFIPVKIIRVNSLPANIINSSDTLLVAIIPKGCGNGRIKLQSYYASGIYNDEPNYFLDKDVICGDFKYNFKPYSGNMYPVSYKKTDTYFNTTETINYERSNGVLQKKIYSEWKYDFYKYKNGKIDSILKYENDILVGYETFLIHAGSDEITHNFFNSSDERVKYHVYKLFNNDVVQWDFYEYSDELKAFYHQAINLFSYSSDEYILDRTVYSQDGSIHYHPIFEGYLDIYNTRLDFNIPGDPFASEAIQVYSNSSTYHNYYNEYGLLIKRVYCPTRASEVYGVIEEYVYQ